MRCSSRFIAFCGVAHIVCRLKIAPILRGRLAAVVTVKPILANRPDLIDNKAQRMLRVRRLIVADRAEPATADPAGCPHGLKSRPVLPAQIAVGRPRIIALAHASAPPPRLPDLRRLSPRRRDPAGATKSRSRQHNAPYRVYHRLRRSTHWPSRIFILCSVLQSGQYTGKLYATISGVTLIRCRFRRQVGQTKNPFLTVNIIYDSSSVCNTFRRSFPKNNSVFKPEN